MTGRDHDALAVDAAAARFFEHGAAVEAGHLPVEQQQMDVGGEILDGEARIGVGLYGDAVAEPPGEEQAPHRALQLGVVHDDDAVAAVRTMGGKWHGIAHTDRIL